MKLTVVTIFLASILTFGVHADDRSGCADEALTDKDIVKIIENVRKKYSFFPVVSGNKKITINRNKCHYAYIEDIEDGSGSSLLVLISPKGKIVMYQHGDSYPGEYPCDGKALGIMQLSEIVRKIRLNDKAIPPPSQVYDVKIVKDGCFTLYKEISGSVINGSRVVFKFDNDGYLYSYYSSTLKGGGVKDCNLKPPLTCE